MPNRAARLKLVRETEASGRTQEIFAELRNALGLPYVSVVFQAYAVYPAFLDLLWRQVQPAMQRQEFFALAERLRASADTRVHSYFAVPDFCARARELNFSEGAREELTRTVKLFHYSNPPMLLLTSAVLQAFDRVTGREPAEAPAAAHHPDFHERPVLIDEDNAPPRVAKVFDDIKRTTGAPVVHSDYRALARFPDFLSEYWAALKPLLESPLYVASQSGVRDTALSLAHELPGQLDLGKPRLEQAGVDDDEIAAVVRATQAFVKVLSGMLLNIAIAKIGLEGGSAKQHADDGSAKAPAQTPPSPLKAA